MGDPNAAKDSTSYKTFAGIGPDGLSASGYVDTPEAIKGMQLYQSLFTQKLTPSIAVAQGFENGKAQPALRRSRLPTGLRIPAATRASSGGSPRFRAARSSSTTTVATLPSSGPRRSIPPKRWHILASSTTTKTASTSIPPGAPCPPGKSLFNQIPRYSQYPQSLAVALTKAGFSLPITPGYLEYFNAMNAAVKDIALGSAPVDRLGKVAKEIDGLLAQYKK